MFQSSEFFSNKHKFQDSVWGQIALNDLERDVIDTPEFQRLFRTSQLGFVDLVYQTANHTRGAHSIGACHVSDLLMKALTDHYVAPQASSDGPTPIKIAPAERVLIRLGALLHDISHVPLSHDIEKKTHRIPVTAETPPIKIRSHYGPYEKHDDYKSNPLLFRLLLSEEVSVLARVLRRYSARFFSFLTGTNRTDSGYSHLSEFLKLIEQDRLDLESSLLPTLLMHLLVFEDAAEAVNYESQMATGFDNGQPTVTSWGLGPPALRQKLHSAWYQPFRHDIIGNTLSADLIDYLKRDMRHLGLERGFDLHLLNYFRLVPSNPVKRRSVDRLSSDGSTDTTSTPDTNSVPHNQQWHRCAIDIQDQKRGTSRITLVNDLFHLLDLRHEIHEKAVMHRVVQAANAMVARGLLLLGSRKPSLQELIRLGEPDHALQGEDVFFQRLLQLCAAESIGSDKNRVVEARRIFEKLIDRRVYRPLMIIPGDRAAGHFSFPGTTHTGIALTEYCLRTLAALVDSTYYSRFFLFVSACIEKYLQSAFDTDQDLCAHIRPIVADTGLSQQAAALVPSRVIIWTLPYKQLYKDPAAVVSLRDLVGPIDGLAKDGSPVATIDPSLHSLLQASIQNADTRYAAMWKLYVFISDGLYYTGLLGKLQVLASGQLAATSNAGHHARLNVAENLCFAALDAVRANYTGLCESTSTLKEREERLKGEMPTHRFQSLVTMWMAKYGDQQGDPARRLTTVNTAQYVHEWDPITHRVAEQCRDSRYKDDQPATAAWEHVKHEVGTPAKRAIGFLENLGIVDPSQLTRLEFDELVGRFAAVDNASPGPAANGALRTLSDLKKLWLADFPQPSSVRQPVTVPQADVPPPDVPPVVVPADTQPSAPAEVAHRPAKSASALPESLPQTRDEFRRWLLQESKTLEPHVRKQLTTEMDPILSYWDTLSETERKSLAQGLLARFENEAQLLFNNIKTDQVLKSLKASLAPRQPSTAASDE